MERERKRKKERERVCVCVRKTHERYLLWHPRLASDVLIIRKCFDTLQIGWVF